MMGPTFSYIAWGCGKDQEEDSEDLPDYQELKEEAKTSSSVPEDCTEEYRTSAGKLKTSPDNTGSVDELSVLCGGEEAAAKGIVQEATKQPSKIENLHAASRTEQPKSAVTSFCGETREPCDIKGDASTDTYTDSRISPADTDIEINSLSVSAEQTDREEGAYPKDINQDPSLVQCDTELAVNQEAGLDLLSKSVKGESLVIRDCSLGIGTENSKEEEETALTQNTILGVQTNIETSLGAEEATSSQDTILGEADTISGKQEEENCLEHTAPHQAKTSAALTNPDNLKEEAASSDQSSQAVEEAASYPLSSSAACHSKAMAAETAQPLASLQETGMDAPPQGDLPAALTKEVDPGTAPAEDRLSPRESPELAEEAGLAVEEGAKGPAGSGAEGSKSEQDGKTAAAAKTKKKEDKSIEYILRALSSLNSPEEKLAALCKKYADLHEEHRVLQTSFKSQQRKMTVGQREKDQLQAEHTKAVIAKSKLESLCRELQKQNKAVKDESILRQKEEEEKRKEISAKFQTTIGEIQTQMTENHEKNVKLREENHDLATKLKKFLEQEELREQQFDKLTKHRELENQLSETKLAHAAAILKEQEEKHLKEKELLLLQNAESQKKNVMLEAQLNMYKDRYEEFQGTINKSNDMFQKLKSEMDKMGKRIKKLEKEGAQWRAKWEASNKALLDMAEEKTHSDKEKQLLQTKVGKLESLCRALQGELHGKKSASPLPSSSSSTADAATAISAPAPHPDTAAPTSSPASTTATPPNTPEENTSRASPNPDSSPAAAAALPPALPTGQNGPIPTSSHPSVPPSSTDAAQPVPDPGEQESSTAVGTPSSGSGVPEGSVVSPPAAAATATQQPEALSSSSLSSCPADQSAVPTAAAADDEAV